MSHAALAHLSRLLEIPLDEKALPAELLWRGVFELEVVQSGNRIILIGVLAVGIGGEDDLLQEATLRRNSPFSRSSVVLSYQADLRRLILWTPLVVTDDAETVSSRLTDLLALMDDLRPVLPSL
jgi:hypothetical protein